MQKKSVYCDYKEDLISREECVEYHADYQEKENHLQKKIELLEHVQDKEPKHVFLENPWIRRLLELRDIETLDRDIVLEMIDSIIVYENHRIVIRYHFSDDLESLLQRSKRTAYRHNKRMFHGSASYHLPGEMRTHSS